MIFTTLTVAVALAAATSAAPLNGTLDDNCTVTDYSQVAAAVANCTTLIIDGITVPAETKLTLNLLDGAQLTFQGTIRFEYALWDGPLVYISGHKINVEQVSGSHFDGNGSSYWDGGSGSRKPLFLGMNQVTGGSTFKNIHLRNCPERCTEITDSDSLTLTGWVLNNRNGNNDTATIANTDGIAISGAYNLVIDTANVYTQDDCMAINRGSLLRFININCEGSRGLSMGAGSENGTAFPVSNVMFFNSTIG